MVDKITIFEPHFDGAQFGPTIGAEHDEPVEATEEMAEEESPSSGGSRRRLLLAGLFFVVIAAAIALRQKMNGDMDIEISEIEPEAVTAD